MPLAAERFPQLAHRLARPLEQALRISLRLQQFLQIGTQRRVLFSHLLPSPSLLADPISWLIDRSGIEFLYPFTDRFAGDSCLPCHLADPSNAQPLGLC